MAENVTPKACFQPVLYQAVQSKQRSKSLALRVNIRSKRPLHEQAYQQIVFLYNDLYEVYEE